MKLKNYVNYPPLIPFFRHFVNKITRIRLLYNSPDKPFTRQRIVSFFDVPKKKKITPP